MKPHCAFAHSTPAKLSSLDINENNMAYSEMDAPFVNPLIPETLSTISLFLTLIRLSLPSRLIHCPWIMKQRYLDCHSSAFCCILLSYAES